MNNTTGPIAYLTGEYPRATDTFIQREIFALRAQGLTVHSCSMRRTDPAHHVGPEQRAEAAQTFHVLETALSPLKLARAHIWALARSPKTYVKALALAWKTRAPGLKSALFQLIYFAEAGVLAHRLNSQGVTHLHNHIATASCSVAMLASRLSGIPFSFTLHGPDIFFEPIRWRLDAKIAEARFVACISDFCRSQAMNFSDPKHWTKLHVVHCGIDPARYELKPKPQGQHLLFVGRLAAVKGVPVLLDALKTLKADFPELRLTLIGDGPERPGLERTVRELGLAETVTFAGYKSQSEVAETLTHSDVFVLPSFAEGVPVVLMEAMAARVPPVTTRIAGIPELIEDGVSGRLIPPGNSDALASAIASILNDPEAAAQMGHSGRTTVETEFNIAHEAKWLARLFAEYTDEHPDLPKRELS